MKNKVNLLFIVAGLLIIFMVIINRNIVEKEYRNFEIITEEIVENINTTLAIKEKTLSELVENAVIGVIGPEDESPFESDSLENIVFVMDDKEIFNSAYESFALKKISEIEKRISKGLYYIKLKKTSYSKIKEIGMGVCGLNLSDDKKYIIRPRNDEWVTAEFIERFYENTGSVSGIVFQNDEVQGFPENIYKTAEIIDKKKIPVYLIEFYRQKGINRVIKGQDIIRLHSVPENISADKIVSRIKRALRERNIRAVYLKKSSHYKKIQEIKNIMNSLGFMNKKPVYPNGYLNKYFAVIGALLLILTLIKMELYSYLQKKKFFVIVSAVFISAIISENLIILIIAVFAPVFAIKKVISEEKNCLISFMMFFAFSVIAGLVISSLSASSLYSLKINQIRGVKAALVLPLLFSFFVVFKDYREILLKNIRRIDFAVIVLIAGAALIYLIRSSNASTGMISSYEIILRDLLEKIFIIRPRFKEFLIGHPLLLLGLYLKNAKYNLQLNPCKILIFFGMIGQISIINTFMHAHTPVSVSLTRTVSGAILGLITGYILIVIIKSWKRVKDSF